MSGRLGKPVLAGVVVAAVAGAVVAGLLLLDSPGEQRLRRLDERREADLSRLVRAVDLYWTRRGTLPSSLDDMGSEPGLDVVRIDPVTARPYEYRAVSDSTYELCAVFDRSSERIDVEPRRDPPPFWSHGSGRQCFPLTARKVEGPDE